MAVFLSISRSCETRDIVCLCIRNWLAGADDVHMLNRLNQVRTALVSLATKSFSTTSIDPSYYRSAMSSGTDPDVPCVRKSAHSMSMG